MLKHEIGPKSRRWEKYAPKNETGENTRSVNLVDKKEKETIILLGDRVGSGKGVAHGNQFLHTLNRVIRETRKMREAGER